MEKERLEQTVLKAQSGDADALNCLFEEYYQSIYYFVLKHVRREDVAYEITQEAFIEIIKTINKLDHPAAFVSWAKTVAYHKYTAYYRKKRDVIVREDEDGNTIFDFEVEEKTEFIPDEALDKSDFKSTIMMIIDELPAEQRSAAMMFYYDEMPIKEIAQIQGVSENTVKSRLNYARKAIKQGVEDYEEKNGIRLHGIAILPLIKWIFKGSFEGGLSAPEITGAIEAVKAAAGISATAAASGTATAATAASVGAKVVVAKIVAGVVAASVTVGGIATAVIVTNKDEGTNSPFLTSYTPTVTAEGNMGDLSQSGMDEITAFNKFLNLLSIWNIGYAQNAENVSDENAAVMSMVFSDSGSTMTFDDANKFIKSFLGREIDFENSFYSPFVYCDVVNKTLSYDLTAQVNVVMPYGDAQYIENRYERMIAFYEEAPDSVQDERDDYAVIDGKTYVPVRIAKLCLKKVDVDWRFDSFMEIDTVSAPEIYVVPAGYVYTTHDGVEYAAGSKISFNATKGDSLSNGEYYYTYGRVLFQPVPNTNDTEEYWYEEDVNGWNVTVLDRTKTEYGPLLEDLPGEKLSNLWYTFANCTNLVKAPKIPTSVYFLERAFMNCKSLETVPNLHEGIIYMFGTFSHCTSLFKAPALPETAENVTEIFAYCTSLKEATPFPKNVKSISLAYQSTAINAAPEIPDGVLYADQAFYDTPITQAVKIPESVKIARLIYGSCENLSGEVEINCNLDASLSDQTDYFNLFEGVTGDLVITGKSPQIAMITKYFELSKKN